MHKEIVQNRMCEIHTVFQRANKNRPREMSSKEPVSQMRDVFNLKKKHNRDPRFDNFCGSFNKSIFKESYSFLSNIKAREKQELQKELEEITDDKRKEQIIFLLKRIKNQERTEKLKANALKEEMKCKEKLIETLKHGKKPYFVKKSEKKKQDLANLYTKLKKSGKLDKYMERKRKKASVKDRERFYK